MGSGGFAPRWGAGRARAQGVRAQGVRAQGVRAQGVRADAWRHADAIAFHQPHRRAERESAPVIMAAHIKCMRMSALFVQKSEAEWHRGNTASVGND